MDINTKNLIDIKLEKVKDALIKNNMDARILEDDEAVREEITKIIEDGARVSVGGSQTLFECGIIDLLRGMDICFEDRYAKGLTREEMEEIYHKAFTCDYYLASSNAVTMNGELYNVDGNSNRVSAISYGPKHVILVVGSNKIVKDLEEAKRRVENIAAPANCLRLNKESACTKIGHCVDCKNENRICSTFVTHKYQMKKNRIIVLLVKEEFGY